MELLNYIPPKERLSSLRKAYNRLKTRVPKGNAGEEIERALKEIGQIPASLVASSPKFKKIYDSLKFKFIGYDDPNSD